MKKNLLLSMLAMAGMILATSCSQEDLLSESSGGDCADATFTIEVPDASDVHSRAVGDGTSVTHVVCAVFDQENEEMLELRQSLALENKTATYKVRLAKGQSYRIAFFAYNPDIKAYDVTDMKKIQIKDEQLSNVEGRDAFTAYTDISAQETTKPVMRTVTLYRPFAQLNLGAYKDDIKYAKNAGVEVAKSKVIVTNVYTTFNAFDDKVEGATTTMEFALNEILKEDLLVDANKDGQISDDEKYAYLALNYLLVGDKGTDKSLTDLTFVWENADGSKTNGPVTEFKNVPVQRNYRTNILGWLLTNPAEITIVIDENFDNPDTNIFEPWDGVTLTEVTEAAGVYTITNGAELAWVAKKVNEGGETFEGKTVELANDIYLANAQWVAIGSIDKKTAFRGTLDGKGHTIYNLNVSSYGTGNVSAGLFGDLYGIVKDLNVKDAKVYSNKFAGVIAGRVGPSVANTNNPPVSIENCSVEDVEIVSTAVLVDGKYDNGNKAGGISGYNQGHVKLVNCSVKNATITGYRELGGISGTTNAGSVSGTVENVTITVDAKYNYENITLSKDYYAGAYVGRVNGATTVNCTGENSVRLIVPQNVAAVVSVAELQEKLTAFATSGSGDNVVNIEQDLILADGEQWSPVYIEGYTGAGNITINGNGYSISNLNAPLFQGGFAGKSGLVINDLTIKDSKIVGSQKASDWGNGAFLEYADAMAGVTLKNCHLINSSVKGSRTGGLIGYNTGYTDQYLKCIISGCTVEGCIIEGDGTVGGIIGHAGANANTENIISNCKIVNCKLVSNDDTYRVGGIVGTANVGKVFITNCTVDDETTMTQNNAGTTIARPAGQSNLYGRTVFGTSGSLTIDSQSI